MAAKLGVIGLGIMGGSISANLVKAGFAVAGYDVLDDKVAAHAARGGQAARSVAELAAQADIIVTSLPAVAALSKAVQQDSKETLEELEAHYSVANYSRLLY